MGKNIVIAPYDYFSEIWTTKWYNYLKHLIEDYGWILIDITDKEKYKRKISLKDTLETVCDIKDIDNILYWHQNMYLHFKELFRIDLDKQLMDKIRISMYYDDVHFKTGVKTAESLDYGYKVFCSCPIGAIEAYLPHLVDKFVFVPQAATNEFMIDLNDDPEEKICLSGFINDVYPQRTKMAKLKKGKFSDNIFQLEHPGYSKVKKDGVVGRKYAELLNKYLCCFSDSGEHNYLGKKVYYVVSKFFEIPATGSLLMANEEVKDILGELGFKDMENYVEFNIDNMEDKIRFILDNENRKLVDKIRGKGQQLVYNQHMAKHRAKIIHETLC